MQRILSYMRKAIEEYHMIEEGDKIAVCLSGGKDSITMLNAFKALQRFYPKKFEIIAVSINPGFEYFDTDFLSLLDKLESMGYLGFTVDNVDPKIEKALEKIAQDNLDIETLKTRKSDELDFHEVAVWGIKAALIEAFELGLGYNKN